MSTPAEAAAESTLHLAYAEASIMLIESLMLVMLERRILSRDELIATIEAVADTKQGFVEDNIHKSISLAAVGVARRLASSISAAGGREKL